MGLGAENGHRASHRCPIKLALLKPSAVTLHAISKTAVWFSHVVPGGHWHVWHTAAASQPLHPSSSPSVFIAMIPACLCSFPRRSIHSVTAQLAHMSQHEQGYSECRPCTFFAVGEQRAL